MDKMTSLKRQNSDDSGSISIQSDSECSLDESDEISYDVVTVADLNVGDTVLYQDSHYVVEKIEEEFESGIMGKTRSGKTEVLKSLKKLTTKRKLQMYCTSNGYQVCKLFGVKEKIPRVI